MKKYLVLILIAFFLPLGLASAEEEGVVGSFFIQSQYDLESRDNLDAELVMETDNLYFYVDQAWWADFSDRTQEVHINKLIEVDEEFEGEIYHQMTSVFGDTPDHPVTEDKKIAVLIHPMRESAGGYFNSGDQYSRYQNPRSNEMSLLYLNTEVLEYEEIGGFLAHEFMHLLIFNQKERLRGVREEVWLNEARAEYMPTYLGYDDREDSNLDRRMETFLRDPDISLTEWIGQRADYGVVNIFTQYLVDHYGVEILADSLKHDEVGIESINHALEEGDHEEDFHDVFNNFKIAVLVNDCEFGEKYCFKNDDLKDLRVSPATNYMPFGQESSLSVQYRTKNWAGNWHKITGGRGILELNFKIEEDMRVEIPYLLCGHDGECEVGFIETKEGRGFLEVEDFNEVYKSLTIMPSVQEKITGFNGAEESFLFTWEAGLAGQPDEAEILQRLFRLRNLLEALRDRLEARQKQSIVCTIRGPLSIGSQDGDSVECLQKFLSTKPNIYPEGYATGNFGPLTEKAVIRFQERYAEDILHPLGLEEGTGYVGERTISKINNLR